MILSEEVSSRRPTIATFYRTANFVDGAMKKTYQTVVTKNPRALARQRILDALDGLIARLIFQTDRFERLGSSMPPVVTTEVHSLIFYIALALSYYNAGEYEVAAELASKTETRYPIGIGGLCDQLRAKRIL